MDPNYSNSSWIYTPTIALADFKAIRKIKKANIQVVQNKSENGMSVTITNSSDNVAFGIEASLWQSQEAVAPVFWSDNYILLQPKEERTLEVKFEKEAGKEYNIKIQGVNTTLVQ